MEKVVLKEDIEAFIKALNEKLSSFYNNKEIASTVFYKEGKKYYKILQKTPQISAYAFIEKETGNILKASGYSTPAKGVRGNIFNENPLSCCEQYSITYWRN